MKQHITVEQLNELSNDGKEKLKDWAIDKEYIEWINGCHDEDCNCAFLTDPLLSIGQMIEFLAEKDDVKLCQLFAWNIMYIDTMYDSCSPSDFREEALCDALWEAVKEVLEKP